MNKDVSFNFKKIKDKISATMAKFIKHLSFVAILLILLVYLFSVWRISKLATAEPSAVDESSAEVNNVPHIDQKAINDVLQLENTSPQVHSLFNSARNNPFGE